jgi:hypothetical protein
MPIREATFRKDTFIQFKVNISEIMTDGSLNDFTKWDQPYMMMAGHFVQVECTDMVRKGFSDEMAEEIQADVRAMIFNHCMIAMIRGLYSDFDPDESTEQLQ